LSFFHDEKIKQLDLALQNEQWAHVDVPSDFQEIAKIIIAGNTDAADINAQTDSFISISSSHSSLVEEDEDTSNPSSPNKSAPTISKSSRHLIIDQKKFLVVNSVLSLLKMLGEYMLCMNNIPVLATDVLHRLLELLKVFNFICMHQIRFMKSI